MSTENNYINSAWGLSRKMDSNITCPNGHKGNVHELKIDGMFLRKCFTCGTVHDCNDRVYGIDERYKNGYPFKI